MRSRFLILAATLAMTTACLLPAGPADAQGKFANKDTAKNRQDSVWGTSVNQGQSYFGTDENENDSWGYHMPEPEPPVDWYDKIVITADPKVDWPTNGNTSTTTSTSTTSTNGPDTTTSSSTTMTTSPNE